MKIIVYFEKNESVKEKLIYKFKGLNQELLRFDHGIGFGNIMIRSVTEMK